MNNKKFRRLAALMILALPLIINCNLFAREVAFPVIAGCAICGIFGIIILFAIV